MIRKRILLLLLVLSISFYFITPIYPNAFKASDITVDTLYDNGILVSNVNGKYESIKNIEVVNALYRLDLLCDYHIHKNAEIKTQTTEQSMFWMYTCLGLPDEFLSLFDENDICTKENLSVLFYYFAKHLDFHLFNFDDEYLHTYSDYLFIPQYSKPALSWALQNKIMPETYAISISPLQKIQQDNIVVSTGYEETINHTQLEIYFINYLVYLEIEKTYGEEIVDFAKQFLGYDYIWGGCTKRGFDCSGFIYYVFSNSGYDLHGHRDGASNYSRRYGKDIMDKCLDMNGDIDWDKVPMGSVIGFDWDGDGYADHVGIWSGDSLIHARGGPTKQYARNGYMVCEYFEGEGNGLDTTFDYAFNDYYQGQIITIRSFEKHRIDDGE